MCDERRNALVLWSTYLSPLSLSLLMFTNIFKRWWLEGWNNTFVVKFYTHFYFIHFVPHSLSHNILLLLLLFNVVCCSKLWSVCWRFQPPLLLIDIEIIGQRLCILLYCKKIKIYLFRHQFMINITSDYHQTYSCLLFILRFLMKA